MDDTTELHDLDGAAGMPPFDEAEWERQQEERRKRLHNPRPRPTPEELIAKAIQLFDEAPVRTPALAMSAIAKRLTRTEALAIMELGAHLIKGERLTDEEYNRLASDVFAVWNDRRWKPIPIEQVLEFTYTALREKEMNWEAAARAASQMLDEEIKPDAWRKRVTKWIGETGREPVGQRKRKPKST